MCVDDTRCEAQLVFQEGHCTACVSAEEKAALCCAPPPGVDCRPWPFDRASQVGGSCLEHADCSEGLFCAEGRAEPLLGTCACPGAAPARWSSFIGCGSPDRPEDREPDLPQFSAARRAKVLLVGDSIAREIELALTLRYAYAEGTPIDTLLRSTLPDAALCDFVEGQATLRIEPLIRSVDADPPDLIVLQFWRIAGTVRPGPAGRGGMDEAISP